VTLAGVLLVCLALVALNGVFVAAEFALIAAPKGAIERRAAGSRHGLTRRIVTLLGSAREKDTYIATCQLGITLASLGLGIYGEAQLATALRPYFGNLSFVGTAALASGVALTIATLAHIVLGEIGPKSVALQHPEGVTRLAYWPMRVMLLVFYPFVRGLNGLANLMLRLLGVQRQENTHEQSYTPEELQLIVEESAEEGVIRSESGRLLQELFEFGELTAGQTMMPRVRVIGIPIGAPPAEVRKLLATSRESRYAVFDGDLDHVLGMVHVIDLLRRLLSNEPVTAADVRPMPVVPETAPLDDVLTTMQRAKAHLAVVIDEHGGTAGLISLEDLFEEVVGDIAEGGTETPGLVTLVDGSVRAAGTLRLDELGQHFDLPLEHDEVDSVSGLVLARLGRPPIVGDVVEYGRLRLEVTEVSGLGVREVRAALVD
jgi:CBS domain containing-hemolysin-like protein